MACNLRKDNMPQCNIVALNLEISNRIDSLNKD